MHVPAVHIDACVIKMPTSIHLETSTFRLKNEGLRHILNIRGNNVTVILQQKQNVAS